jgi:NAD(P)-dependent dehydrogenase (short-subunit alcohol dehydrogenase family)
MESPGARTRLEHAMSEQPVAMITGAGSGIGRATAMRLGHAGYRTVLVGRTLAKLAETQAMLDPGAPGADLEALDLCDAQACVSLVARVVARHRRLDAIANVAGDAPLLPIEQVTAAIWRRCIDTNLSCVVHLTAAAWPTFRRQGAGAIVNVSSMASVDPFPGFAIYAAAKIGVNLFTRCTAREGASIGVRAVCIAPGAVETPMLRSVFDRTTIPPERTLDPAVVAAAIVDCITGQRPFEPGQTIHLPSP